MKMSVYGVLRKWQSDTLDGMRLTLLVCSRPASRTEIRQLAIKKSRCSFTLVSRGPERGSTRTSDSLLALLMTGLLSTQWIHSLALLLSVIRSYQYEKRIDELGFGESKLKLGKKRHLRDILGESTRPKF